MTQKIQNPETEKLAELAGEAPEAMALRKRLADELDEIALRCSRLPVLDSRAPDKILGYDERGLPR